MDTGHKIDFQKVIGLIPDDLLNTFFKDIKLKYCLRVYYRQHIFNLLDGILTSDKINQTALPRISGRMLPVFYKYLGEVIKLKRLTPNEEKVLAEIEPNS